MRIACAFAAMVIVCPGIAGASVPVTTAGDGSDAVRPVYVTNRGIAFDGARGPHGISRYTVGPAGDLVSLGTPVPTGDGARGIVFAPDGRTAYVVATEENAVYSYRVDARGELRPLGSPVDTKGIAPFGLAIAPNGRSLYVANLNSDTVSVFTIDRFGKPSLAGEPVATGAANARNVVVTPDGRFLFVAHGAPSDEDPDALVTFPIRPDGTLGPVRSALLIGATGMGLAVTPDGRYLYVTCALSHQVYGFHVGTDGDLEPVPGSPVSAPKTPEGLAVTPDGRTLFVTSVGTQPEVTPDDDGLWTFSIGVDGALTVVGRRSDTATGPGVTTTPDGRYLYVSNFFANTVSAFEIGTLRQLDGSPAPSMGMAPSFNAATVPPNQGPHASFTVRAQRQIARFDATASSDKDGRITRYDWNFGDGTTLPDGGPRPSHVYRDTRSHWVTLVVTDNEGCSSSLVFTGRTALCTGGPHARTTHLLVTG
jgi:6-phosphogluconolactonase (cycloisomerase 2 family)